MNSEYIILMIVDIKIFASEHWAAQHGYSAAIVSGLASTSGVNAACLGCQYCSGADLAYNSERSGRTVGRQQSRRRFGRL